MHSDADRFLPTRRSLLTKLKSWDNHDSWREFFETYWRLIYDVARRAGLNDAEAQDVVQETILSVAKQMPGFRYDRSQGTFKSWLRHITRCRIADVMRTSYRAVAAGKVEAANTREFNDLNEIADPTSAKLDTIWDEEWRQHLEVLALESVKARVNLEHYQIFELHVLKGWPAAEVAQSLGVATPTVYWIRQRVGAQLRKEMERLEAIDPQGQLR